ncbi:MAG TPA: arginase family protein [Nitrososphaerales archaeon]|nr:arginase family protein [Nitrososphaerales archaeon]
MQRLETIGLPIFTLARYSGMGLAPAALRRAAFATSPSPWRDLGDVELPRLERDTAETGIKNLGHFSEASEMISRTTAKLASDSSILCLGGECSLIVGSLAGLAGVFDGRPGMLWMDSHGDFNTPETSPSGYIGGMCLAMAVGRGPELGRDAELHRPLIQERAVVHLGSRALDSGEERSMKSSEMWLVKMTDFRKHGVSEVASQVSKHLADRADWLICHLDVDVIDPTVIPAVNYPTPGGLYVEEIVPIIRALQQTGRLKVINVTAYNPSYDPNGQCAQTIAQLLKIVLG